MNKFHKTALALAVASSFTCTVSAESFRESLQNGKFSGDLNNVVAQGSATDAGSVAGPNNNSNVGSSAVSISYKTAPYKGLMFGIGFQYGYDWNLHDSEAGLSSEDDSRNSITSSNLQNFYLDYSFNKDVSDTSIRIGRQDIISPLIMRSSMFPLKDSFDAVVLTNKDIADTTVKFMYVESWNKRYGEDATASPVQQDADFDGSVYSVYLNNKSIKGFNVEAQWMANNSEETFAGDPPTNVPTSGPYETTFVEAIYNFSSSPIMLGAKQLTASFDNAEDTSYWGVKAGTKIKGLGATIAYTAVDDDNNLPGTLGHVPMFRAYANTVTDAEFIAGVEATSLSLTHNLGVDGLKAGLVFASWEQSEEGFANSGGIDLDGASEIALDMKYSFKSVEGLSARLQLSQMDYDLETGDSDMTYSRLHMKYAF